MRIAGVDCGKEGAVCALDTTTGEVEFLDMPLLSDRSHDTNAVFSFLLEFQPEVVITEFTLKPIVLVQHTGEIMAMAKILQAHLQIVAVNTWKKKVLGEVTSDKKKSIAKALEINPNLDLIKPRCRVPSHDRAEAFLLAQYYLMTNSTGKNP